MILGEPTVQSFIEFVQEEGCPRYDRISGEVFVNGLNEIALECDHVVDATQWIDASELEGT